MAVTFLLLTIIFYFNQNSGESSTIYVLKASSSHAYPFDDLTQEILVQKGCQFQNCFFTDNPRHRKKTNSFAQFEGKGFDAVLFNAADFYTETSFNLPRRRSPHQKYIFVSTEPASQHPVEPPDFDEFFNWTWTYKLDSDIPFNFITVKDKRGNVIGPKKNMRWINVNHMKPTTNYVKNKLRYKNKIAAWFVSNCDKKLKLNHFFKRLEQELSNFGQNVDVYGECGNSECPNDTLSDSCHSLVEANYYFYFIFEDASDVDYAPEDLLIPLRHFAVPVVYGGANYSRFMPPGSYLDARALGPTKLANKMVQAISKKYNKYYKYFRWHRYYSFHHSNEDPETDSFCALCAALNEDRRYATTVYEYFSQWWNLSIYADTGHYSRSRKAKARRMNGKDKDKTSSYSNITGITIPPSLNYDPMDYEHDFTYKGNKDLKAVITNIGSSITDYIKDSWSSLQTKVFRSFY